jgi:hypothetical protein
LTEPSWPRREKETARRAFDAAYERECRAIADRVRKSAAELDDPRALWRLHDYLTLKKRETDRKYDYRYSVTTVRLSGFAVAVSLDAPRHSVQR